MDSKKMCDYKGWLSASRFFSSFSSIYCNCSDRLEEVGCLDQFLVFFSRNFLRDRGWSIIPVWEGDLRFLQVDHGRELLLINAIRDYCRDSGGGMLHVSAVDQAQWPYSEKSTALTFSYRGINVFEEDPSGLFEIHHGQIPYWGHNFMWPSDESLVVYFNGDNAAFIAGEKDHVENLVGFSLEYGLKRFVAANSEHPGWRDLVGSYVNIVKEFM